MGKRSYPRERCDGLDVAGLRKAAGEDDAQVPAWALGGWRSNAQTEHTREIRPPSPPHSPGTAQPSWPTRQDQSVASPRERMWWWGWGGGAVTRRSNAGRPVVRDREDWPRPGPSGFKATGRFRPGREASAPSRLRGPRPLPRPLRPLNVKPPEGRRDPALLRTQGSPHGPPPPGPGHGPHKPQQAPRLLPGSLTLAAGSCQTTSP